MIALLNKEISSFFNSLIGYVAIIVFLLINSLFLWVFPGDFNILDFGYASLDSLFMIAPFVFLFLIPAITMRSFAEEKRSGTIEIILTKPLTDFHILFAKYLAGLLLVIFSLLPTLLYVISVYRLGQPVGNLDMGGTWGSYLGLLFLGASFVAIGIFASSLTENQIIAFVVAVLLCGFAYLGFELIFSFDLFGRFGLFIQSLGIQAHYASISRGVIDTRDVVYFLSLIFLFLTLTLLVMESRRWEAVSSHQSAALSCEAKRSRINSQQSARDGQQEMPGSRWSSSLRVFGSSGRNGNLRTSSLISFGLGLVMIMVVNMISKYAFTRIDLTSEKRYSLSEPTKEILRNLDDIIYFKVYLEGDFPAGFKRLSNSVKEILDEFRAYSSKIQYEFINPSDAQTQAEVNARYEELIRKGLNPTDLQVKTSDGSSQQIIFPGAIVSYRSKELPLEFLQSQIGQSPEEVLNHSVQSLEYNISSLIHRLTVTAKPKIAFVEGHGELSEIEVYDITEALREYYQVERIRINEKIFALTQRDTAADGSMVIRNKYAAIIIAKPDSVFSEKDKFIIDQYIMLGGKVLWLIDPVLATMDSLEASPTTMGLANDLNLQDMLFRYGVRLNPDLLLDLNALPIRMVTGSIGGQPQISFVPWFYFPVVFPMSGHPMVRNLNAVMTCFVSSLDTIGVDNIHKTILLTTSEYTRILQSPVLIDLRISQEEPDPLLYRSSHIPIAVLLEGEFESVFNNRIPPQIQDSPLIGFKEKSVSTGMIVASDGDIIRNQLHVSQGYPLPLGFDQYTRQQFGNRDFILNAVNYLCDDSGLIAARSKDIKLRLLDKTRLTSARTTIRLINTLLPVALILVFAIARNYMRKRKFGRVKRSLSLPGTL
ncbi:MAG: gliding motility-associated ABC transporter substrate-binding protein GldG [Bacteroidales bacterium]|nr:gliding motility-associated ABC transporter substrate-binding protein GldG [Bacteroidales bacterium]